ncbi:MAG: signal peptidase I [Acidobacteria bacterium]|nr:signal peptidase I [Acidobacteriota bacterium]
MMKKRRRYRTTAVILVAVAIVPSYVRVYRVHGSSDAPTYLVGDRIIVNKAAFDLRIPYTNIVILSHSEPESGDVVMFQEPGRDILVFKRLVGLPGDTLVMRDNCLTINGISLKYSPFDGSLPQATVDNKLGSVIMNEIGIGEAHQITYTPEGSSYGSFGPVEVPAGHYYLMGDNRDNSRDSRMYGPVPRRLIVGRVSRPFGR